MFANDIADLVGGVIGHAYGAVVGFGGIAQGIAHGNFAQIGGGVSSLVSDVIIPRLGSHGGLDWPGTQSNVGLIPGSSSQPNLASIEHDVATGRPGGMWVGANHLGWVHDAWAGPGIQPGLYGNAYRIAGTVGFGLAGVFLSAFVN